MTLSRPYKEDRLVLSLPSLSPPGDRWCDALALVCASQAPKYSGYSENQSTWEGCFARRCINLLGHFLQSGVSRTVHPKEYNTIQLYCLCVEKCPFWLVIYIKHSIHFIRHQQFKGVRRWMSTTDTFQSGLLFFMFYFL